MIVLDMDHLSCLEWGSPESARLRERLAEVPGDSVFVSIISYEEQMRGWLAHLAGNCSVDRQVRIYAQLRRHLQTYCSIPILDFTSDAAERFEDLRRQRLRVGTMDLRIAAICLTRQALLLTRNMKDFERVPGLQIADWTN
jgi:tRNA(fMet)-specific endonuclease VapC